MVIEGIVRLVAVDREVALEIGVAALELEMILDDLREEGRTFDRHAGFLLIDDWAALRSSGS